jgi:hypothetical protein
MDVAFARAGISGAGAATVLLFASANEMVDALSHVDFESPKATNESVSKIDGSRLWSGMTFRIGQPDNGEHLN